MRPAAVGNLSDLVGCLVQCAREFLEGAGKGKVANAVPSWLKLEAMAGLLEVARPILTLTLTLTLRSQLTLRCTEHQKSGP